MPRADLHSGRHQFILAANMSQPYEKPRNFHAPQYWWLFIAKAILWIGSKLPYRIMLAVGNRLGWLISHFNTKNKRIILRNLSLCFPNLSPLAREQLTTRCWQSHAIAGFETAMAWWGSERRLRQLLQVKGEHHLYDALASKRGIMILTGHFTTLELAGVMLSLLTPCYSTAKHLRNPVADYLVNQARRQHLKNTLFPENLKQVHQLLRQGAVISFLLDQDYGTKGSVFAPFFNIPTATTNAIPRIAKMTNSIVIPTFFYRLPKGQGYQLEFQAPLTYYMENTPLENATFFNQAVEKIAKRYPEQYGWTYKRFATRPKDEPSLYD